MSDEPGSQAAALELADRKTLIREMGALLKGVRARAGLSLRDVQRKAGIPRSTVSNAESGKHLPTMETGLAIISACRSTQEEREHFRELRSRVVQKTPNPQPASSTLPAAYLAAQSVLSNGRPARRYEVMRGGNLLSADRVILATTNPGDVFFAIQLNAPPYAGRHYGFLEMASQNGAGLWGYIDKGKLAHGRSDNLPPTA
jgi:DNA-binding XRE family transcriptional regulator